MKITRREFTKQLSGLGVGGIIAAVGASSSEAGEAPAKEGPGTKGVAGQMKLRRLGKTGLMLSPVGFGAQRTKDADLIRYGLDQGMNHIETAWIYGFGKPGNSCECVGKAIAGRRDSVILSVAYEAAMEPTSKAWLPNQFEQTLRRLGTDHIDVFLWHDQSGGEADGQSRLKENQALVTASDRVDLMLKWKNEGKVRWCGIATHFAQAEWLRFIAASEVYSVALVAFNYKSSETLANAMQEASQKGVGLIAMKTQSPNYMDGEGTIGNAPDHGEALRWVLSKDYITAAIPGMTTRSQVDLNVKTMGAMP
jgi:aryl-alcohol dehydrogenase-like predicted oxidoreductase